MSAASDSVFGSWPRDWPLAQRFPLLRFAQLPLPLVSSVIWYPFLKQQRYEAEAAGQRSAPSAEAPFAWQSALKTSARELVMPATLGAVLPVALALATRAWN